MQGYIDNFDWINVEPMKYWSFSSTESTEKKKSVVHTAVFSGDYIGARKCDGYYQRVIKDDDGNIFMIARGRNVKGEVVEKHEWLPHLNRWFEKLPNGTCVLCECYLPNNEGSKNVTTILGCLKDKAIARQKNSPLHLYIFDVMAYEGKNYTKMKYEDRAKIVFQLSQLYQDPCVEYAEFFGGKELWDMLQFYLSCGYEGMVIMRKDAIVYNKRTPARVSIKVKKELTDSIDCIIIGANPPTRIYGGKEIDTWSYWQDTRTGHMLEVGDHYFDYEQGSAIEPVTKAYYYNWAASFKLGLYNGDKIEYMGDVANLTDEMKENWKSYVGRVVEIGAMEADKEAHTLRHPRIMRVKSVDEKTARECTIEQF